MPFTSYGGIFVYTKHMLESFRQFANQFDLEIMTLVAPNDANEIATIPPSDCYRTVRTGLMRTLRPWRLGGAVVARALGASVLFCPNPEILPIPGLPTVVTIHDVAFLRFRQYSSIYNARLLAPMWIIAKLCRRITTNSQCSKNDIIRYLGVSPTKVQVIYHGYDNLVFDGSPVDQEALQSLRRRFGLERPYLVHHGTLQPRKNLEGLIRAYQLMLDRHPDLEVDLVLAGKKGWDYESILGAGQNVRAPGRVVFTDLLPADDLAVLLKGAELSVIPSVYEGFCYPMVESMASGVPTIVSNTSCLPEISGGVLQYFNPLSLEEISETMATVLRDTNLRQQLRRAGLEQVKLFSWERCAKETLAVLKDAGNGNC
jgi:glycosyltransferase involved in cell wall biosynthesis